jgi:hypothetical protein
VRVDVKVRVGANSRPHSPLAIWKTFRMMCGNECETRRCSDESDLVEIATKSQFRKTMGIADGTAQIFVKGQKQL